MLARGWRAVLVMTAALVLAAAAPAGAWGDCLVWIWIDGWRCAV